MQDKIFIIGHKSPDLDSVAAAISCANLKNTLEKTDKYIPVTAEGLNKETEYILDKINFSKPEVLKNAQGKELVLVDHNEFSQGVDGIEEAVIKEVIDHHKVDFKYSAPITFKVFPLGASCTIIATEYLSNNIEITKEMAMLMLSAILVDTVITKSPTCTEFDKIVIKKLAKLSQIEDWQKFGMEIFNIRSSVKKLTDIEVIKSDFKDFNFKQGKIGIGQVETVNLDDFKDRKNGLISEMKKIKKENDYHSVVLLLTDIINEGSEFLVVTDSLEKMEKALSGKIEDNKIYKKGIISRKKQVAPKFSEVFDQ